MLEQFQLWHRKEEIGLDHIHGDAPNSQHLLNDGLRWIGIVSFNNTARNKKQISRTGLEALFASVHAQGHKLDWSEGFKVTLEGVYWRHSFVNGVSMILRLMRWLALPS